MGGTSKKQTCFAPLSKNQGSRTQISSEVLSLVAKFVSKEGRLRTGGGGYGTSLEIDNNAVGVAYVVVDAVVVTVCDSCY